MYTGLARRFVIFVKVGEVLKVEDFRGDGKSFSAWPSRVDSIGIEASSETGWTRWSATGVDYDSGGDVVLAVSTAKPGLIRFRYCIEWND